jgi:hypothetical protein
MRIALFMLSTIVVTAALSTRAEAQNYPWCAVYSGDMGGSENCGFTTFQQCMEDVSGIGGFCQQNNTYTPTGGAPSRHSKTRRY